MRSHRHRGRPPIDWASAVPLLGKMSDADVAEKLRCSRVIVTMRRTELKIPPYGLTDALVADLGRDTDAAIARKHGVHYVFVMRLRRERGIPAHLAEHGTPGRYRRCKCEVCRTANAARGRQYRRDNPEKMRAYERRRRLGRGVEVARYDGSWMFDANL